MLEPQNRRYIGNKFKLIADIQSIIDNVFTGKTVTFADLFAGTGVIGYHFAKQNHNVIVNDTLYSNVVAYNAWFSNVKIDNKMLAEILQSFNVIDVSKLDDNYFSQIYAGKYYSFNNAKAIGYIREQIEGLRRQVSEREYFILLTSLLYYSDKIANTVGHFEYYLRNPPEDRAINLEMLNIDIISNAYIKNEDANILVNNIECDVAYLDPPYNARQYVNFYHVLENLARWDKPTEFEGVSMKFKRNHLKSGYSRSKAPELFSELINTLMCSLIIVSYNNTYNANSTCSNNKIQEEFLVEVLSKKGKTYVKEIKYKAFNTGNTHFNNHLEKLYVCEVRKQ
ncbi:DNA adenine methylase [Treponema endosymbiont of Eucomonympha sp.]|uniref:DNA adenine methylase n=1 Tax=Treponema endosymbiont of Eucomonympha sp. TaxID=1580831 RepID=UPI000750EEAB|nr:DNA adenine methylase [Treponema endosymbiont of Eucomonympha sp.]